MVNKKTSNKKIDHIRSIIDNPYQKNGLSDDKYEAALRARLKGINLYREPAPLNIQKRDYNLKPTITIHHEKKITPPPQEKPIETFQEIPQQEPILSKPIDYYEEGEDIFEIVKAQPGEIPVFVEVKQKDKDEPVQFEIAEPKEEIEKIDLSNLPKWEPVVESEKIEPVEEEPEEEQAPPTPTVEEEQEPPKPTVEELKSVEKTIPKTKKEPKAKKSAEPTMIWEPVEKKEKKEKKSFFNKIKPTKQETPPKEEKPKPKEEPPSTIEKLPFEYKDYKLYKKEIDLGNNNKRIIRFFSKEEPEDSTPSKLPKNYEVKINKKTGVPYIRKKQT